MTVTVVLPTLNEQETIETTIKGFQDAGFDDILVVDGGSDDKTRARAIRAGATVHIQQGRGKGQAVRESFEIALRQHNAQYVVLCDADATYEPEDAQAMLGLMQWHQDIGQVVANRFAGMASGAMPTLNQVGNQLFTKTFNEVYDAEIEDLLSGFCVFSRGFLENIDIEENGFGLETELTAKGVQSEYEVVEVDSSYYPRPIESESNLHPIRDGAVILRSIFEYRASA